MTEDRTAGFCQVTRPPSVTAALVSVRAARRAVSEDDLVDVVSALTKAAKEGDVQAAKLLLSYAVGRPCQMQEEDFAEEEVTPLLDYP